jgi:hypothetical protein
MTNAVWPEEDYWVFETKDYDGNQGLSGGMINRQSPQLTVTNHMPVSSIDEYPSKNKSNRRPSYNSEKLFCLTWVIL